MEASAATTSFKQSFEMKFSHFAFAFILFGGVRY